MIRYNLTELKQMGVVYDVQTYGPLDTRQVVYSYESLFSSDTWINDGAGSYYVYNGMFVAVAEDSDANKNGIYFLLDQDAKITSDNPETPDFTKVSNWHKLCELSDLDDLISRVETLENNTSTETPGGISEDAVNELIEIQINKLKAELAQAEYVTKPDIANFITINDVEAKGYISEIPSEYITEEELDAKGYLKEHQDISGKADIDHTHDEYALKTEVPSIAGLATETFVINKIAEAELNDKEVDLSGYATKDDLTGLASVDYVDSKVSAIKIPDTSNFITEIPSEYITESELEAKKYLTEHQDLSEYAKKSELPENEIFVVNFAAPDFSAAFEAYKNGKVLVLANAAPDVDSYAIMNYVREDLITFTKFLMSRSCTYGAFNTYYLHNDNTWELAKEVKLNKVEANVSDEAVGELSTVRIGKQVYTLPSTEGLASEEFVRNALNELIIPEVPTKVSQLENDSGYITEHQNISHLATKDEFAKAEKIKYEVLPVDGMLVTYRGDEIRLNTQRVTPNLQNVGEGGSANTYYITFRAYAPEGATHSIEHDGNQSDPEPLPLSVDSLGRKYSVIWSGIAVTYDNGNTWTKWGDMSTKDKCLGFTYTFDWYSEDTLIGTDTVRLVLTNDTCHNELVPDVIARRMNEMNEKLCWGTFGK